MTELELKYGCNPNQKPSKIFVENGELPIEVLNGKPGYINFMDAFNGWQLVKELKAATGLPAATSFKHVSPAGAAVGLPLTDTLKKIYWVDDLGELSFTQPEFSGGVGVTEVMRRILSQEEQQIVTLHVLWNYKHREIAETLGCPVGTVTSKYKRAVAKLKKELKEEER